jgi:hypothetical protein
LSLRDYSSTKCFVNGLDDQFLRDGVFCDDIQQRPHRRRHANAVNRLNVSVTQLRPMKPQSIRERRHSAEAGRHRHVQLRRHHVGEFVEAQSRRVTEHALRFVLPIPRPELPHHQIRARRQWELGQPIDASRFTNPIVRPDVIRVNVVPVSGLACLPRREIPALMRCERIERSG